MESSKLEYSKKIREILSDISKQSCDELALNDDLFSIGVLDSFGILEFLVSLEERFNCTIPPEELIPQNLCSIEAIYNTLIRCGVLSSFYEIIEN